MSSDLLNMDTLEPTATESQAPSADPPPAAVSPALQRARRRHTWRRVMTASTWGLLLGTGLLLAQQSAGDDHAARGEGAAAGRHPDLRAAAGVGPQENSSDALVDAAVEPCAGADCGEPHIPLKISIAPPQVPAHAGASATPEPELAAEIAPVQDEAASPECLQVVQEMASLQAARKDASEPGLRSLIDERLSEAQTRRIFLHCAA